MEDAIIAAMDGQAGLEALIGAIERAAWTRSWSRLKKARAALKEATGIEIRGALAKSLGVDGGQVESSGTVEPSKPKRS